METFNCLFKKISSKSIEPKFSSKQKSI